MEDTRFRPKFVPRRTADLVARQTVLRPLYGNMPDDRSVLKVTYKVQAQWRQRIDELWDAGCEAMGHGDVLRRYMRNCAPAFVAMAPQTRACRMRRACPFCYARRVSDMWHVVDAAVPRLKGDARPVSNLAEVQATIGPFDRKDTRLLDLPRLAVRLRKKAMRRQRLLGGLVIGHIVPSVFTWNILLRVLVVVRSIDDLTPQFRANPKFRWTPQPSRADLQHALSRTCRYPTWLMNGDAASAAEILDACHGTQLWARYGSFRRPEKEKNAR